MHGVNWSHCVSDPLDRLDAAEDDNLVSCRNALVVGTHGLFEGNSSTEISSELIADIQENLYLIADGVIDIPSSRQYTNVPRLSS
jgi:hypothetical protein